jgi:hypothetical protein
MVSAQHANEGTLIPHYLNSSWGNAKLDRNIRQQQNSTQAIIVRNMDYAKVENTLNIPAGTIQIHRDLADECGLSFALRVGVDETTVDATDEFEFTPSDENITILYLHHRALVKLRGVNARRFRFQHKNFSLLARLIHGVCENGLATVA